VLADRNDRLILAPAIAPIDVVMIRLRRPGDRVGLLVGVAGRRFFVRLLFPVEIVLPPRHLALADPQRLDTDRMLWPLMLLAPFLGSGAAHQKRTAGNGDHVEGRLDAIALDGFGVGFVGVWVDEEILGRGLAENICA